MSHGMLGVSSSWCEAQVYEEDSRASRSSRQKPGSMVGIAMKLQNQQRLSTLFQLELTMDKLEG